ncbi:MAG: RNase adapter RapZ [Pseudomonadota bacterium]
MSDDMRLIIVSGLSGSGKSVALHVLEDLGFYCIDNLPAALLKSAVVDMTSGVAPKSRDLALGIDARNRPQDIEALPEILTEFRRQNIQVDVIFLQADDDVLLKRFSDTRRRHPLAEVAGELKDAIRKERALLSAVINMADLIVDSSRTSIYELADIIRERVDRRKAGVLSVLIESFGFKHGIPSDADFVFDLRTLPNPYWTLELRGLTGLDSEVSDFLEAQPNFVAMHDDILSFLQRWIPIYQKANRAYLTIALGCTGGQHRSVYMTEKLSASLKACHDPVLTRHTELSKLTRDT